MRSRLASVVTVATLLAGGLAATSASTAQAASDGRPANDDYAAATVIAELPFADALDLWDATDEVGESAGSCYAGGAPTPAYAPLDVIGDNDFRTVWYRLEPEADMTVTIDPMASGFEVGIHVYEGDDLLTQTEVACTRSGYPTRTLVVDLDGGSSYAVQVTYLNETAPSTLRITFSEGEVVPDPIIPSARPDDATDPGIGDATVVAVIDSGLSPYHWDFLASRMPQALDANPHNDLPLDQPPHTWLPGFPDPETAFTSYRSLDLTLDEDDPTATYADLRQADLDEWDSVRPSGEDDVAYHWIPNTKVIGALTFDPDGRIEPIINDDHGHAVASAAAGNYVGTCPECLLVFIELTQTSGSRNHNEQMRAAHRWAQSQPWIDVVQSSDAEYVEIQEDVDAVAPPHFGWFGDRLDVAAQRAATERGQTLFQAAGNGMGNAFTVPNPTMTSSMMGPDWLVTVGGSNGRGDHLLGAGKVVDVAAPANWNRVSRAAAPVGRHEFHSGTSFSSPAIAGIYAHTLHHLRRALPGPSRIQADGVIATATGEVTCAATRPDCELADGAVTAAELRARLLLGAVPSSGAGTQYSALGHMDRIDPVPQPESDSEEWRLANEGHGTYRGRMLDDADFLAEVDRILDPMFGVARTLDRPAGERDWMTVDSYCRQELWGAWDGGYYVEGQTPLPGFSGDWPVRSSIEASCPHLPFPLDAG